MFHPVARQAQTICFLLLPGFSLFGLSCMLSPLRHANRSSQQVLYRWQLVAETAGPVCSSDGIEIQATGLDQLDTVACVIVCSGEQPEQHGSSRILSFLRKQAAFGAFLGGQDTGAFLLAMAGVLEGYRSTLHWENLATATEQFPGVEFSQELYVIDRNRFACSGALSGLDMMLYLIQVQHGQELARDIADMLLCSQPREQESPQKAPLHLRLNSRNRNLADAVQLMEVNTEEPLSIPEIARYLNLSVRELERLFRHHLKSTPQAWYRQLRLNKARRLLQQTDSSVTRIAGLCGFRSLAHFSRCYRQQFRCSPSQDR